MKAVAVILAGSLLANVLLVGLLLRRSSIESRPATAMAEAGGMTNSSPTPRPAASDRRHALTPALATTGEPDFVGLVAVLRAAGFSTALIRNVVEDAVGEHFQERRRELGLDGPAPHEFWKNPVVPNNAGTPEQLAVRRALDQEMRGVLRSLFGRDFDVSDDARARRAHGLPADTAEKLHTIFADYRDIEERARNEATSTSDIGAKLALIEKEKRADIERLLTPEELAEFDLRMGVGNRVHNILGQFSVTEAEFRALVTAHKAFTEANPGMTIRDRPRFMPEIRRVLGEERYAEYEASFQQNDQQARNLADMRAFTASLNLPPAAAAQVIAVQAEFQPMIRVVAGNPNLTSGQRAARLAQLGAEARQQLSGILGGASGLDAYAKTKGAWLPEVANAPAGSAAHP